ncbi:hypothetical protein D3093_08790 [Azospirillum argentinense]|uniref:Uncharacterized protein n=1 Tax=Azospirillum argentinense TaxID=2970906 RepID=A0A4D8P941_9PROT|nr:hypothetical protein [Azospirillum argentinense]QCN95320.1 hypothetical protein D3093_08660 [Azospirillum argentinense]QCN95343.1 hypothetical protein D3093_08790 [Azospirillum argentinense]
MKQPQLNLRFPEEHHDLIRRLAERLRADPAFAEYLEDLLSQPTPPVLPPLQQRLDAALAEIRLMAEGYLEEFSRAKAELQQQLSGPQGKEPRPDEGSQTGQATGDRLYVLVGRHKRITEAGVDEFTRRLALGEEPELIATDIGIGPEVVRNFPSKPACRHLNREVVASLLPVYSQPSTQP